VHVAELWRYPVKSLAGEQIDAVEVRKDGIPGDRSVRVVDGRGRPLSARTMPRLLALRASLDGADRALVNGRDWEAPETAQAIAAAAGADARLKAAGRDGHWFDESPLLVATDGAIEELGYDGRRFRANIVIGGVEGMAERGWRGRRMRAGGVEIDLGHLCERCVMTTFDPDTQAQDPDVLRRVNAELDGTFARNCWVVAPGRIAVGDPVDLL
jgi:uncharacterized protein YcbX